MDAELLALLIAIGVPLALRLIDYLLPKGHHFKFSRRWAQPDDEDEPADD